MACILGIETSCDETSVAIVSSDGPRYQVHCNLIAAQIDLHEKYGGVVPEIASRAHLEKLDLLVAEALTTAGLTRDDIDAVAVTNRPGLIGALLIGVTGARTLAWAWDKPLIGVNHIHAHCTSAAIALDTAPWPAVALVVSGGHTSLYHVRDHLDITLLGATIDDAAGEAFDKIAAILNLGFPGGPAVDRTAKNGNPTAYDFPRALPKRDSLDFSFSGLKTAVLYQVHGPGKTSGGLEKLSDAQIADICAAFSAAVVDVLVRKTLNAAKRIGVDTVVIGGGVAANSMLRERLTTACEKAGRTLHLTPMQFCTDNAAMIAALALRQFEAGQRDPLSLTATARA